MREENFCNRNALCLCLKDEVKLRGLTTLILKIDLLV